MLVTRQPVLRRFWYPVLPSARLAEKPLPFRLLGEDIVLWRGGDGVAAALKDRCCHRTARLSKGWVEDGALVCGYHGWAYGTDGRCLRAPQFEDIGRKGHVRTPAYRTAEHYGYIWVALEEPLAPLPEIEEASAPGYRLIQEFYEPWACAGLRVMENSFDNAHFSFVHRTSFGVQEEPKPASLSIEELDDGFVMRSEVPVRNPDLQRELLGMAESRTVRHMTARWFLPFARKLHIRYPNGLEHIIVTAATPIDDASSMLCQFTVRNDTEADAPAEKVIAFDRQVTAEDRDILESTDWDVPLALTPGREAHMPSDRPGLVMRKMLAELLARHGEHEISREGAA